MQGAVQELLAAERGELHQQKDSILNERTKLADQQQQLNQLLASRAAQHEALAAGKRAHATRQVLQKQELNAQQQQLDQAKGKVKQQRKELSHVLKYMAANEDLLADVQALKEGQHQQQVAQLQEQLAAEQSKRVAAEAQAVKDVQHQQQIADFQRRLDQQVRDQQGKESSAAEAQAQQGRQHKQQVEQLQRQLSAALADKRSKDNVAAVAPACKEKQHQQQVPALPTQLQQQLAVQRFRKQEAAAALEVTQARLCQQVGLLQKQLRESQQSVAGYRFPVGSLIVFMVLIVAALLWLGA
jgi:hypothetical protein